MSSAKEPTVEDASPSPPTEVLEAPAGQRGAADPAEDNADLPARASPSEAHQDDPGDEEWDPAAETSLRGKRDAVIEKNTASTAGPSKPTAPLPPGPVPSAAPGVVAQGAGGWQAIWAPANNAYYFWNATTGAVTWENPLAPKAEAESAAGAASSSGSTPLAPASTAPPPLPKGPPPPAAASAHYAASSSGASYPSTSASTPSRPLPPSDGLPPIDPGLAHLLPKSAGIGGAEYQTAQFNARTGRFTAADYQYTPDHLSEAARAKRMSGVFFDVDAWEKGREEEHRARLEEARKRKAGEPVGGGPAKKVTKEDIERFKQKKLEKKARNNAWLRE